MRTILAKLSLIYVILIAISLIFSNISYAKIDPATCDGMWLFDDGGGLVAKDFSEIGRASWYEGSYFTGIIDDAGLFSKALTKDDIVSVMNKGLLGKAEVFSTGKLATTWASIK